MVKAQSPRLIRLNQWSLRDFPFPDVPYADPFSKDPLLNGTVFDVSMRQNEIGILRTNVLGNGWRHGIKPWRWLWSESARGKNLGTGKTAFLGYIMHEINKDYGKQFLRDGANWLAIYTRIDPGMHDLGKMNAKVLAGFCNDARSSSPAQLLLAKLRQQVIMLGHVNHSIAQPGRDPKRYINEAWLSQNAVDTHKLNNEVEAFLKDQDVTADVATAFAHGEFKNFLKGLNQGQNIGMPGARLARRATSILLDDIARIVKVAEIQHLTIFLDDFYFLVKNLGEARKRSLAEEIRKLCVDGPYFAITERHLFNWVAVMHPSTAPNFVGAWSNADLQKVDSLNYQTVQSDPDQLLLRKLRIEEGESIIRTYLERVRLNSVDNPVFPFTSESIQAIIKIIKENAVNSSFLQFHPRDLLVITNEVFMKALDQDDFTPPISVNFVEHIILHNPLLPAESEDDDLLPEEEVEIIELRCPCSCHGDEIISDVISIFGGTTQSNGKHAIRSQCKKCRTVVTVPDSYLFVSEQITSDGLP